MLHMFSSIRRAKILLPFLSQRLGDYAQLARLDLTTFRDDDDQRHCRCSHWRRLVSAPAVFPLCCRARDGVGYPISNPRCLVDLHRVESVDGRLRLSRATFNEGILSI